LAKKLRLAAAGLTDVGRRRERNQDNVAHFVPNDDDVLEQKGALFVVCDGMGGHAAGEVAAEIGVNSLRDLYYQTSENDIISAVASAIKQANEAIYAYAREHPGMAGMGTTCVALVVQGGRGYFLNIGDSRAYIVRERLMRQVTLDHSWVAEQVRAGVLTEEQARTHAHRNVITRSLGTQPTVSADLFIETLHDGDRILLCSDGLHGYVDEQEIEREMVEHADPELGAQHLIDMANANGGPDNITALIVHMVEVPEAVGELTLPLPIEEDPEQIITRPVPVVAAPRAVSPEVLQEKLAAQKARRRGPSRVAAAGVRLLAVAALIMLSLGVWDLGLGPYAQMRVATDRLQADVSNAQQVASHSGAQDPGAALTSLSTARDRLVADLHDPLADPAGKQSAQTALDSQVVPAVQSAITRYESMAVIQPVAPNATALHDITCAVKGQSSSVTLAEITETVALPTPATSNASRTQMLYVLDSGIVYQLAVPLDASGAPAQAGITCGAVAIPNVATVAAISADGGTLYALAERSSGAYLVVAISPTLPNGFSADGTANVKTQERFTISPTQGEVPQLLAVQGGTSYVGYKPGSAGSPGIWTFSGSAPKAPSHTTPLSSQPAVSLAAAGSTAYALLADGSMGNLDSSFAYQPIAIQVLSPLVPGTTTPYTGAMQVPTASGASDPNANSGNAARPTTFPGGATLTIDPAVKTHLLVSDPANMRIVLFDITGASGTFQPVTQYVYGTPLAGVKGVTVASDSTLLTVYAWSGSQLATFSMREPSPAA
jgi:serine/threonine protein phosphatase PrpC